VPLERHIVEQLIARASTINERNAAPKPQVRRLKVPQLRGTVIGSLRREDMMAGVESSLVDAKIRVYAESPTAVQHQASRALLESELNLCCSRGFRGILCGSDEPATCHWSVHADRSESIHNRTRASPASPACTCCGCDSVAEFAERHEVTGASVFDLQLAATMIENGVRRIYTYNRADFETVKELDVLTPE
jgi:predicted nucleic acid-binding protein